MTKKNLPLTAKMLTTMTDVEYEPYRQEHLAFIKSVSDMESMFKEYKELQARSAEGAKKWDETEAKLAKMQGVLDEITVQVADFQANRVKEIKGLQQKVKEAIAVHTKAFKILQKCEEDTIEEFLAYVQAVGGPDDLLSIRAMNRIEMLKETATGAFKQAMDEVNRFVVVK